MIGFPLALLYANALEWGLHRWVLHGLGRKRTSFFAFHFHEHHRASRKNGMRDAAYERPIFSWRDGGPKLDAQNKEILSLLGIGVLHAPLLPVAPWFYAGLAYAGLNYYRVHRRAHLDPEWARTNLPWHVDHHMGPNQDANWCVTKPWFDIVMGTRIASEAEPKRPKVNLRPSERTPSAA